MGHCVSSTGAANHICAVQAHTNGRVRHEFVRLQTCCLCLPLQHDSSQTQSWIRCSIDKLAAVALPMQAALSAVIRQSVRSSIARSRACDCATMTIMIVVMGLYRVGLLQHHVHQPPAVLLRVQCAGTLRHPGCKTSRRGSACGQT